MFYEFGRNLLVWMVVHQSLTHGMLIPSPACTSNITDKTFSKHAQALAATSHYGDAGFLSARSYSLLVKATDVHICIHVYMCVYIHIYIYIYIYIYTYNGYRLCRRPQFVKWVGRGGGCAGKLFLSVDDKGMGSDLDTPCCHSGEHLTCYD